MVLALAHRKRVPDVKVGRARLLGAAGLLVVMLLPQVWQLYKTKNAGDLSHLFLGLFNFGEQRGHPMHFEASRKSNQQGPGQGG